jgi:hypothetical protein
MHNTLGFKSQNKRMDPGMRGRIRPKRSRLRKFWRRRNQQGRAGDSQNLGRELTREGRTAQKPPLWVTLTYLYRG